MYYFISKSALWKKEPFDIFLESSSPNAEKLCVRARVSTPNEEISGLQSQFRKHSTVCCVFLLLVCEHIAERNNWISLLTDLAEVEYFFITRVPFSRVSMNMALRHRRTRALLRHNLREWATILLRKHREFYDSWRLFSIENVTQGRWDLPRFSLPSVNIRRWCLKRSLAMRNFIIIVESAV